ncbi:MAG: hypothetical protein ACM3VW_04380 [Bacteroidota bacterium]
MRWNSKWIIAAVLLLWYALGAIHSMAQSELVYNWRHPAPPPQASAGEGYGSRFMFQRSLAMGEDVERHVRLAVYPGSRLDMSYWFGRESLHDSASLSTDTPLNDVLRFYSTKYASRKPLYQRGKTPHGQSVLMFWQQPDATYLVMIRPGDPVRHPTSSGGWTGPEAHTVYSLARLSHPLKLVEGSPLPWERNEPLSPVRFGLPLPPGSRVDYCGWARAERGMMGMALAEVNSSGSEVGSFYRDLVRNGSYESSGNCGQASWHNGRTGQYEVKYYQTHESLPTIVVLQHRGGQWWDLLLPRLWN